MQTFDSWSLKLSNHDPRYYLDEWPPWPVPLLSQCYLWPCHALLCSTATNWKTCGMHIHEVPRVVPSLSKGQGTYNHVYVTSAQKGTPVDYQNMPSHHTFPCLRCKICCMYGYQGLWLQGVLYRIYGLRTVCSPLLIFERAAPPHISVTQ